MVRISLTSGDDFCLGRRFEDGLDMRGLKELFGREAAEQGIRLIDDRDFEAAHAPTVGVWPHAPAERVSEELMAVTNP